METILRIKNLNPYFTLHVDSTLIYRLEINKDESKYYWYLRNSPVGLRINKDNGTLTFKAEKSYFLSGKLRYDNEYRVNIGVQSLDNPAERIDTSFAIVFYNTEIVPAKMKPSVNSTVTIEEGDTLAFKVQCEFGSFPIDNITFLANLPMKNYTPVKKCDDEFIWSPPFDFVKETDPGKEKVLLLSFIGSNRFMVRDTAVVKVIVKDALNYPFALQEFAQISRNIRTYVLQLKYTFVQLDKGVKKTKNARTGFDITSSTTALTGTILTSSTSVGSQKTGKILPSVGVSLVPIKEAVAPQKVFDQNQASSIRSAIKRMEYMLQDNSIVGERDPDIAKKTNKLKDELKQIQVQLIDIPLEFDNTMTEKELNDYFNSRKVNKKYRLKK
ncbi:hypothetical protein [Paraflavitalea sp. CAU 1676]|uniref:hypothetical protein n=1 Tax=Paraflavitalea sp. CAU 1676 TaxID=3032598 RepID=UPI0023DC9C66|nr:hypothetical protein [Paraflavitalea sp. CAU 1676]